jgi:hypothetical protein
MIYDSTRWLAYNDNDTSDKQQKKKEKSPFGQFQWEEGFRNGDRGQQEGRAAADLIDPSARRLTKKRLMK